jgi:putative transposase
MLLRRGPIAAGFTTDRWTLARIQHLLQYEFNVSYSTSYLADKLYDLGWNSQAPIANRRKRKAKQIFEWPSSWWHHWASKTRYGRD